MQEVAEKSAAVLFSLTSMARRCRAQSWFGRQGVSMMAFATVGLSRMPLARRAVSGASAVPFSAAAYPRPQFFEETFQFG